MNVLMCGQNYHITGGSDRVFFDEIQLLEEQGHVVAPFCADSPKNLPTEWAKFFPRCASFDRPGPMDVFRYVYSQSARDMVSKVVELFKPDVAHLHIYYGKLTASILKPLRSAGVPVVQTLHEYKVVCPTYTLTANGEFCDACSGFKFINSTVKRCNRGSLARSVVSTIESYVSLHLGAVEYIDRFIAVSDFLKEQVVRMGVPESKVVTIHNFVDVNQYPLASGVGDYFLYYGRLERNKGVWPLLNAFAKLKQFRLVVVGEGAEGAAMRQYCQSHPVLSRTVTFMGFKSKVELIPIIHQALCTIVPSIWNETFGLTVAESLACGKPVIASRIGGIPEVVENGEDSILVPPGDVDSLIEAVELIGAKPSLAVEMGMKGRTNISIKFSRERHYDSLHSVYRGVAV